MRRFRDAEAAARAYDRASIMLGLPSVNFPASEMHLAPLTPAMVRLARVFGAPLATRDGGVPVAGEGEQQGAGQAGEGKDAGGPADSSSTAPSAPDSPARPARADSPLTHSCTTSSIPEGHAPLQLQQQAHAPPPPPPPPPVAPQRTQRRPEQQRVRRPATPHGGAAARKRVGVAAAGAAPTTKRLRAAAAGAASGPQPLAQPAAAQSPPLPPLQLLQPAAAPAVQEDPQDLEWMDEWLGGAASADVYSASDASCAAFAPDMLPAPLPMPPHADAAPSTLFGEEEGPMLGFCGDWGMAAPLLSPGGRNDDDDDGELLQQLVWGDEDMLPALSAQEQQLLLLVPGGTGCSAQPAAQAALQPVCMPRAAAGAASGSADACCTQQFGRISQLLGASVPQRPPCSSMIVPTSGSHSQLPQLVAGTPLLRSPPLSAASASAHSSPHSPALIMEAATAAVTSWVHSGGAGSAAGALQPFPAPSCSGGVSSATLSLLAGLLSATAQPPPLGGALSQGADGRLRGELLQLEMQPKGLLPECRVRVVLEVELLEP